MGEVKSTADGNLLFPPPQEFVDQAYVKSLE